MRSPFLPLFVAATLILATGALAEGQESKAQASTPQALRSREAECEARLQEVYRQRSEGVGKVYPSAEAKAAEWQQLETALQTERTCLTQTDEALVKALAAQEAECQKLAERRGAGTEDASRDAARCAAEVRRERAVRQQVKGFRAQQYTCEAQVAKFDDALRAPVAPPPTAPNGTAPPQDRSYRDQTAERRALEQARERSLVCAQQAAAQLGHLKGSQGASPVAAASEEAFQRDTAAVLELIRRAGEGASTGTYEAFAKSIETLRGRLATYRYTHQVLITRDPDAARRLVAASDALFSVAQAWESELRAGRDAVRFRAEIEAAMRRDASPTARASLPNNQRGLESATNVQAASARARADALSRLNSSLAGLQTLDVPPTGAR
jgi:hypothetical protein